MIYDTHETLPTPIKHIIWTGDNIDEVVKMTGSFYNLSVSYPSKRLNAGSELLANIGDYVVLNTLANGQWVLRGYQPKEFDLTFRAREAQ